jgi:1-acyl-sn-glycerol-3-phosphate acyltransferase
MTEIIIKRAEGGSPEARKKYSGDISQGQPERPVFEFALARLRSPALSYGMFYLKTFLLLAVTIALAPFYFFLLLLFYPWRRSIGPKLVRFYSKICLLIYRVKIERVRNYRAFKKDRKGLLIISNHSSFLDIFVLSSLFETVFVSKAEVKYYPIVGQIAWLTGVVFFDRASSKERLRVLKAVAGRHSGRTISVFPQGTTGRISDRLPFQRGIFKVIELNRGITLLPVTLYYKEDADIAWSRQTLLENAMKVSGKRRVRLKVILHHPLTTEDCKGGSTAEICKMVEKTVLGPLHAEY